MKNSTQASVYSINKSEKLTEIKFRLKEKHYNRYFNSLHITLKMSGKELCFFDYLCEKMDEQNRVFIDNALKDEFHALIKAVTSGKIEYAPYEIATTIRLLRELKLVFEVGDSKKSYYYVNPKYAFKGAKKNRLQLIEQIAQERIIAKKGVEMLVSVPLDEYYQLK